MARRIADGAVLRLINDSPPDWRSTRSYDEAAVGSNNCSHGPTMLPMFPRCCSRFADQVTSSASHLTVAISARLGAILRAELCGGQLPCTGRVATDPGPQVAFLGAAGSAANRQRSCPDQFNAGIKAQRGA